MSNLFQFKGKRKNYYGDGHQGKWSHDWGSIIQKSDTDCKDDNGWLHLAPEMSQPASGLSLPADTVNLIVCGKLPNPADVFATPCMAEQNPEMRPIQKGEYCMWLWGLTKIVEGNPKGIFSPTYHPICLTRTYHHQQQHKPGTVLGTVGIRTS